MKNLTFRGRVALLGLLALSVFVGLAGIQGPLLAQSADLVPVLRPNDQLALQFQWAVTTRLGFKAVEFSILTANIGDADFVRPGDPDNPSFFLLRQIYEYVLEQQNADGGWDEIDRRRKPTICTIDDTRRGLMSETRCMRASSLPRFGCGGTPADMRQGVSRGWADDYFRGLSGQYVRIDDNVGSFRLTAILDPDNDLQRTDIPASGRDSNPDNNTAQVYFDWDGTTLTLGRFLGVDLKLIDRLCGICGS